MENRKIDINEKLEKFKDQWSPKVVAEMNDYQVKLEKYQASLFGINMILQMSCFTLLRVI